MSHRHSEAAERLPSPNIGRRAPRRCLTLAFVLCLFAAPAFPQAAPFAGGERLTYSITWPSGLGLGEVAFHAQDTAEGWRFEATITADLPILEIRDEFRSSTDASLCSSKFEKKTSHGKRKTDESVTFDQRGHTAQRVTSGGGGESEFAVPPCARDGLAFLYYLREQLAAGRIPPPDDLNFGAQYQVSLTYAESVEISSLGKRQMTDRMIIDLTGPASQHSFEVFFARDAARTPLLMRVPFELGTFSLKLVP